MWLLRYLMQVNALSGFFEKDWQALALNTRARRLHNPRMLGRN